MVAEGPVLIDDDLASFVRGPVSAFLGTADAMGTPDATRIVGVLALDDRHFRVLISERARAARQNATVGANVAVIVTDITTYRSVQWKGRVVASSDARSPGDTVLIDHHISTFAGSSTVVGIDPAQAWRFFPIDGVPLVVEVEESFDQTPGPGAGRQMQAAT